MPTIDLNYFYTHLGQRFRRKRFEQFLEVVQPSAGETILDIGGTPGFWVNNRIPNVGLIVSNLSTEQLSGRDSFANVFVADGCQLPFASGSVDIAFSNSVIEHVGDFDRQTEFAKEVLRVGKRIWVQTPAKGCPVEPHFIGLFVHWFGPRVQRRLIRWFTIRGLLDRPTRREIEKAVQRTRLITRREFAEMFPGCRIRTERLLWVLPKSYIALRYGVEEGSTP